jgi:DNA-binding XRE family transcriptional regulator
LLPATTRVGPDAGREGVAAVRHGNALVQPPDKLKQIRERSGLTPEKFAPRVNAKNGATVTLYESGKGDLPIAVLMGYCKLSDVPLENLMNNDRDLWLGSVNN